VGGGQSPIPAALIVGLCLLLAAATTTAQDKPGRHGRLFPPEELGVLEGPDRDAWQMPDAVMDALKIAEGSAVADIGAGGGWFTIRLARRVGPNGTVYAQDVQAPMIEAIRRRVDREGLKNVQTVQGDELDPRLAPDSVDAILIVDAYHEFRNREGLLRHLARALRPGGRIGLVDFTKEGGGPGPLPDERLDEQTVIGEAERAGLRLVRKETFLPFQYLLVLGRASAATAETGEVPERGQQRGRERELQQVGHDKRVEPGGERRPERPPRR
jgi:ubiquinone/menaquinone biosynthesis C-methylase UbiE